MFVKVVVGIVFDTQNPLKIYQKMVPRGFQEALERLHKSIQKKVFLSTQIRDYDCAGGLPDSPPRVRGFEQLKTIIEQETAVAAIVVAVVDVVADVVVVDVVADVVAVVVVIFVVVVAAVFVVVAVVAIVANVVVAVVFSVVAVLFLLRGCVLTRPRPRPGEFL